MILIDIDFFMQIIVNTLTRAMSFQPLLSSLRIYKNCINQSESLSKYEQYNRQNYNKKQCTDTFEMVTLLMFLIEEFGNFQFDMLSKADDESIYEFGERCIINIETDCNVELDHNDYLNKFNNKLNSLSKKFDWRDVELVADQLKCSNITATIALTNNNCDLIDAILHSPM